MVLLTVSFVLQAATSLRASQACFDLVVTLQGGLPFESASHTTIQNWILRIGLYELQRPKEFADDWIWVVDHTIQIGPIKVLLILGVRRAKWKQLDRPLVPTDLEVLESLADSLAVWSELIDLSQQVCRLVRHWGYARGVAEQADEALPIAVTERGCQFRSQLIAFVRVECAKLPAGHSFPGSSEAIESLIGKGKRLEGQQSQSGFTRYVLGLAASVVTPTASLLESVSETVGIKHLTQWLTEHLSPSLQSKRLRDLGRSSKEQKQDKPKGPGISTF